MTVARIGAAVYVLWGLLHLYAAYGIYRLGAAELEPSLLQARLFQDAAFMLAIAVVVLTTAVGWNWRNAPAGYWVNLAFVSVADIVFLLLVVLPGHVPLERGLIGPALWVLAAAFSTVGYLRRG
jgi:hypothetical protein